MAQAVVGALRVDLSMDSAAFEAGSKKATGALGDMSKVAKIAGAAIGTAMVAAAAAVSVAVKNMLDEADKMSKLSQKIGIPIEDLSRLAHAADLSGVSLDQLATGVGKLSKNMVDAARTGTGPIAEAFTGLGIEIKNTNGTMRSATDVMTDIADRFAGMEDGARKTGTAMTLFGRSGADLIPLLNLSAAGMRKVMQEADELGIVIDEKTGRSAEAFNDNLTRLGKVTDGLALALAERLAGPLETITDFLVLAAKASTNLDEGFDSLAGTAESLGVKKEAVAGFFSAVSSGAWSALGNVIPVIGALRTIQALMNLMPDAPPTLGGTSSSGAGLDGSQDVEVKFSPELQKAKELAELKAATDAAAEAERARQAITAEGVGVMEGLRTPQEAYEAHLRRLSMLLDAGAIDAQTFERAQGMAAGEIANHYASVAAAGAAALGSLFEDNKAVAIASAIINTLEGITAALKLPFPLNWAQGAAVATAGFAQVAKIRSTSKGSSGGGGAGLSGGGSRSSSSSGSGGAGGAGGRAGAPGANAAGDGGGPGQAVSIVLQGNNFSREQVRDMLEGLNDLISDGAVLKVSA